MGRRWGGEIGVECRSLAVLACVACFVTFYVRAESAVVVRGLYVRVGPVYRDVMESSLRANVCQPPPGCHA